MEIGHTSETVIRTLMLSKNKEKRCYFCKENEENNTSSSQKKKKQQKNISFVCVTTQIWECKEILFLKLAYTFVAGKQTTGIK